MQCSNCMHFLHMNNDCFNQIACLNCKEHFFRFIEADQIEMSEAYFEKLPTLYNCISCRKPLNLILDSISIFCYSCEREYCGICKNSKHFGEACLSESRKRNILCVCNEICEIPKNDLFYLCKNCNFRCMVCMKTMTEISHVPCSYLSQMIM